MTTSLPARLLGTASLMLLLAAPAAAQTTEAEPATTPTTEVAYDTPTAEMPAQDLVSRLESLGSFSVLLDALTTTGLDAALRSGEPYTLFAPTDSAFASLPPGTLETLSPEQRADLVRYHLVAGAVHADEAARLGEATSVQGSPLALQTAGDGLLVNDVPISYADVQAENGVIHVIDTVLLPPGLAAPPVEEADPMEMEAPDVEAP